MQIGGLQKMTLLDYPGRVACTVFLPGCNFRCPFCHNAPLVLGPGERLDEQALFAFLEKRRGLLDGVAVTGGEPLLQPELETFLRRIKALGYPIKLDTNGSFPNRLRGLLEEGLVDYIAMDIKNCREKYDRTAGAAVHFDDVAQSAALLLEGRVPYEFRTTVVEELHEPEDFEKIGVWLSGAEHYYLQGFVDSGALLTPGLHAASHEKMLACLAAARQTVPAARLRGE